MTCCHHCQATDAHFSPAIARHDLKRYHRKGPDATTRLLIEGLRTRELDGGTLLDIGAGIGVLHHELLGAGVSAATHVEASAAYIAVAQEEAERLGHGEKVQYVEGDVVDLAPTLERADAVTLDRVICCYPDWKRLVETAASKAVSIIGLSVPHERWYLRVVFAVQNLFRKLARNRFRTFVHPVDQMDRAFREMGFRSSWIRRTIIWHVALYVRDDSA